MKRHYAAGLCEHSHQISKESSARISGELLTILSCGYSARAVRMMWECGLLDHVMHVHAEYISKVTTSPPAGNRNTNASAAVGSLSDWLKDAGKRSPQPAAEEMKRRVAAAAASDAAFERDPMFRVLAALDKTCTPQKPASEELVYACLAAPFAIRHAGWPVPPHPYVGASAAGVTL